MKPELYDAIITRARGRCEVEVELPLISGWSRCGDQGTEVHHLLPKSRGGRILDEVGETYHLILLCKTDHLQAHSRKDALGLMIDGSVVWDKLTNQPHYTGTDPYLMSKYTPTSG